MIDKHMKSDVVAVAKRRRNRQGIALILLMVGVFLLYEFTAWPEHLIFIAILAAAYLAFFIMNWRCPVCGAGLGRPLGQKACGSCGARLL